MRSTNKHQDEYSRAAIEAGPIVRVPGSSPHPAAGARHEKAPEDALAFWQPRASRVLTVEDARQITENLQGFFQVLDEWDRAEQAALKELRNQGP